MSDENPYASPSAEVAVDTAFESALADRWSRLGGALFDGIVLFVVVLIVTKPSGFWDRAAEGAITASDFAMGFLLGVVIHVVINGYTLAKRGQSIGKVLAGTRIVSASDGRLVPLWKLILLRRIPVTLVGYIPYVGGIFGLANILLIFTPAKRCGHDYIAGTIVVTEESVPVRR